MTNGVQEPTESLPWDTLVKATIAGAALLPLAGVVIRWISFSFDCSIPEAAVLAAPVPELTATGAVQLLRGLPGVAIIFFAVRSIAPHEFRARRIESRLKDIQRDAASLREGDPSGVQRAEDQVRSLRAQISELRRDIVETGARLPRLRWVPDPTKGIGRVFWVGFFVVLVIFSPLDSLLQSVAGLMTAAWMRRIAQRSGLLTFPMALVPVVALLLATAIIGGITPTTSRSAMVHFRNGSQLTDGSYLQLGQDDHNVLLRNCQAPSGTVSAVPRDAIQALDYSTVRNSAASPSIWDLIWGAPVRVGFQSTCPTLRF